MSTSGSSRSPPQRRSPRFLCRVTNPAFFAVRIAELRQHLEVLAQVLHKSRAGVQCRRTQRGVCPYLSPAVPASESKPPTEDIHSQKIVLLAHTPVHVQGLQTKSHTTREFRTWPQTGPTPFGDASASRCTADDPVEIASTCVIFPTR